MHLSHSQINLYDTCPRAYEYRYIEQPPKVSSLAMSRGKVLHAAIAMYLQEIQAGKIVGRDIAAAEECGLVAFQISDLPASEIEDIREQMALFADNHYYEAKDILAIEQRIEAPLVADGSVTFQAVLDLVTQDANGVYIVDFKTQMGFPSHGDPNTLAQLRRYTWAWSAINAIPPKTVAVDYTRWWGKCAEAYETLPVNPADLPILEKLVKADCLRVLKDHTFNPRPSPRCALCAYQRQCLEAGIPLPPGLPIESAGDAENALVRYMFQSSLADTLRKSLKAFAETNGAVAANGHVFDKTIMPERVDKMTGEILAKAHARWEVKKVSAK